MTEPQKDQRLYSFPLKYLNRRVKRLFEVINSYSTRQYFWPNYKKEHDDGRHTNKS